LHPDDLAHTLPAMGPRLLAFVCSIAFSAFASLPAQADAGGGNGHSAANAPPGYEQSVQRALREFELANYAEARAMLLSAHELYPNARTLRALGMVEYELKNYAACVAYMEQALASSERPLNDEQRERADELRKAAENYIGRYMLNVRPRNASVLVNGEAASFDAQGRLVLAVGDHELDVSAEGHRPLHRVLKVVGRQQQALDIVLVPVSSPESLQKHAQGQVDKPLYKKWWLWTTVGLVVVAGATVGAVLATRPADPHKPNGGSLNETFHLLQLRR
jgi:tetratricopeptide (TPR) repeat protein